jgi:hypothetical protein
LAGWIGANGIKSALIAAAFVAALVSLLITFSTSDAGAASVCDKTASSNIQGLADSLRPGQIGCLRKGVYTDGDKQLDFKHGGNRRDRIKLRSYPGERARFRGAILVDRGSDYITVQNMKLDGSYGPQGPGHFSGDVDTRPAIRTFGSHLSVIGNNITNRRPGGNEDLAGQCLLLGGSAGRVSGVLVKKNRIHHCGQMPRINREHGIYAPNTVNAKIVDNLIYENADRGVQLYPNARGTLVEGNVMAGNDNSSQNTIRNNVFSTPRAGWNIYSGRKATGSGNFVQRNCLWTQNGTSGIRRDESVFVARDNVVADPGFSGGDLTLARNSLCRSVYQGNG